MSTIHFVSIEYKNFLSTGNASTTIQLDRSTTTLISGKNGHGKSTITDAITYALFGKPFRDIKLSQLINSINGKQCECKVTFNIGTSTYKVIRGMKPSIFEIYKDGLLLNQDASNGDYQKVLEQQILRLNYKTFTQVVILGSAAFVPFMQLKASQRREVVEDILDIRLFSVMNRLLKDRTSITKDSISKLDSDIKITKTKVESKNAIIKTISKATNDRITSLQSKIVTNDTAITESKRAIAESDVRTEDLRTKLAKLDEVLTNRSVVFGQLATIRERIETHKASLNFFTNTCSCPSCKQTLSDKYKTSISNEIQTTIRQCETDKDLLISLLDKLDSKVNELEETSRLLNQELNLVRYEQKKIELANADNVNLLLEIEKIRSETVDIETEKTQLKQLASNAMVLINQKTTLQEERELQEVSSLLLKDTGIKTAIIREYLPVMNTLINKFLSIMDTYIKFELDEAFNEVIKSRHRDEFTYFSFSEGEKKRIDIAILFAWRQVAKMKNSVNTNLLILDETFDSSLDDDATGLLFQLLDELSYDTNIFVISHKGDILTDKFRSVIRIEKKNDFSTIVS